MTGSTYPRSSGKRILPLTWANVQARRPGAVLSPDERTTWDAADTETRASMRQLANATLTTPPDFLQFDLAGAPWPDGDYPGAVPIAEGIAPGGRLVDIEPTDAATALGIDIETLEQHLRNFAGPVELVSIPAGNTPIYRTLGLTATSARYGAITNRIPGEYFDPTPPTVYPDVIAWRKATAVKAEWNGDHGYFEMRPQENLIALYGQIGLQVVDEKHGLALPGGGYQYYIPNIDAQAPNTTRHLRETPLVDLIRPTGFQGVRN